MLFTVYKTTNLVNGRYYIGVHKTQNLDDDYLGSGYLVKRAIAKYGRASFKKEVLFVFEDAVPAYAKEKELVPYFRQDPLCYNLIDGGLGGWQGANRLPGEWRSQKRPPETGQRISAAKRGKKNPKLSEAVRGVPKSEQAKHNMSVSAKIRAQRPESKAILIANGIKSWQKGYLKPGRLSDAAIELIRQKATGRKVSATTRMKRAEHIKLRSPEFNAWCVRKRWATIKSRPFSDPKPSLYRGQNAATV